MTDHAIEVERLRLEAEVWRSEAEALVALAGPAPTARCLDACCGPLGALEVLAAAAPNGEVVGLDADPALVDDARQATGARRLRNVTVMLGDLLEYHPDELFDVVYMRFAPVTVGRPAREMLDAVRKLCRPGGSVLLQEPFGAFHYAGAPSGGLEKLLGLATVAYRAEGVDLHAGKRLAARVSRAGMTDVVERRARLALPPGHPYLRLPLMLAEALREAILNLGTVSRDDLDALVEIAEHQVAAPRLRATTFELVGVAGRVPVLARFAAGRPELTSTAIPA
jgi:SAM-dependent methyltransferase